MKRLAFCLIAALLACNKPTPEIEWKYRTEQITVGMTYEEVERLLGKPSSISRGSTYLDPNSFEHLSDSELVAFLPTPHDPQKARRLTEQLIKFRFHGSGNIDDIERDLSTYGRLMDRAKSAERELESARREAKIMLLKEDIRLHETGVPRLTSGERAYWSGRPQISTSGQLIYSTWIFAETRIETLYTTLTKYTDIQERGKARRVPEFVNHNIYGVALSFCVLFDIAGGRVSSFGYKPIGIGPL